MSLEQKMAQLEQLQAEIALLRNQEKSDAVKQVKDLIVKYAIKSSELRSVLEGSPVVVSGLTKKRGGGPSKFQYVSASGQVYKGRGPKPEWFAALSEAEREATKQAI